jgi:hypothetical protein
MSDHDDEVVMDNRRRRLQSLARLAQRQRRRKVVDDDSDDSDAAPSSGELRERLVYGSDDALKSASSSSSASEDDDEAMATFIVDDNAPIEEEEDDEQLGDSSGSSDDADARFQRAAEESDEETALLRERLRVSTVSDVDAHRFYAYVLVHMVVAHTVAERQRRESEGGGGGGGGADDAEPFSSLESEPAKAVVERYRMNTRPEYDCFARLRARTNEARNVKVRDHWERSGVADALRLYADVVCTYGGDDEDDVRALTIACSTCGHVRSGRARYELRAPVRALTDADAKLPTVLYLGSECEYLVLAAHVLLHAERLLADDIAAWLAAAVDREYLVRIPRREALHELAMAYTAARAYTIERHRRTVADAVRTEIPQQPYHSAGKKRARENADPGDRAGGGGAE